jgi:hypothetical protein
LNPSFKLVTATPQLSGHSSLPQCLSNSVPLHLPASLAKILTMQALLSLATLLAAVTSVAAAGKYFDRVLIVVLENESYSSVIADPNFAAFAKQGRLLKNSHGVTHPSQPNYLAMSKWICVASWLHAVVYMCYLIFQRLQHVSHTDPHPTHVHVNHADPHDVDILCALSRLQSLAQTWV